MVSSRAVLLLLNTFFFFLGFGILAIGLWSQYDPNFSVTITINLFRFKILEISNFVLLFLGALEVFRDN